MKQHILLEKAFCYPDPVEIGLVQSIDTTISGTRAE